MDNKVSIKELNKILQYEKLPESIKFDSATFSEVDIVFIGGLFLLYRNKGQKLPSISFNLEIGSDKRHEIHKSYFKQINDLYDVDYTKIITDFPNSTPTKTYEPESYSSSFAPPILITKGTINVFFGKEKDVSINNLKTTYIDRIKNSKRNNSEKEYFQQSNNILKELFDSSPVHTFIFCIAYNKIAPFVNTKKKGFDSAPVAVKQIWLFTQEYVKGLYELAKNIVEHSGQTESDGEGIITIRAYSGDDLNKVLETYVFDYGNNGVLQKLKEYTSKLKEHYSNKLANGNISEGEEKWISSMYNCYDSDLRKLENNYKLSNFIIPPQSEDAELQQQVFRDIAHYGLRKFYQIIKKYNGEMKIASNHLYFDSNRDVADLKNDIIDFTGTAFYFQIPFDPQKFKQTEITASLQANLTTVFGSTTALQELHKIQHLIISSNNYNQINQCIETETNKLSIQEKTHDVILDYKLNISVKEKSNVPKLYKCFENLKEVSNINIKYLAIDLENIIDDVSILLRFISHLTANYEYPFIIYNLNNKLYQEMIRDIENFYNERYIQNNKKATYWHNDRAILVFTKTEKRKFHFADILYGADENDFLLANKIINSTFPNSMTILRERENLFSQEYSSRFTQNKNLKSFFNNKLLLPFDTILSNDTPLFIDNLTTILTNELTENRKSTSYDLESYIDMSGGYHISNTHFKIGGKIHSEDFYYAKGLFQNSFYTTRLAMYMASKLIQELAISKITHLTIIGYEMYSELLLSLTKKFIEDSIKITVNHFVAQDEDGKLQFKPKMNYNNFIKDEYKKENGLATIIVPIASTGSTANKILETIYEEIIQNAKKEKAKEDSKKTKDQLLEAAKKEAEKINLSNSFYNILWARPTETDDFGLIEEVINFENKKESITQKPIIILPAIWHTLDKCKLCYGKDIHQNQVETLSLFETDKSSLTPAIVFGNPVGKKQNKKDDVYSIEFDDVDFSDSLKYKTTFRNNEYLLYSTDTEKLIVKNKSSITLWLNSIKEKLLKGKKSIITMSDKIIIISPCHETNSSFINLVNQYVFNSAATIIHYQSNVDFSENFKKMNSQLINSPNTKIFYVDDSLISGKHFFNLFDLVRGSREISQFDGTIVLSDKSTSFTHDRIERWSEVMFSFVSYNQPPSISLSEQRPLEYERQRYKSLSDSVLHDALIKSFNSKANKINPKKSTNIYAEKRHLRLFEATHKIYDYFSKHEINDFEISSESFINFKDKSDTNENNNTKLKVLSQYPFILYKPLREKTFAWHKSLLKDLLEKINHLNKSEPITLGEYNEIFRYFKLLTRRAVFLGNYQIIESDFLEAVLTLLGKIEKYNIEASISNNSPIYRLSNDEEKNLNNFPLFLLCNYLEMIQKNGWIAVKLTKNISELENKFKNGTPLGKQFYRMLQIETAVVVDDYVKMIEKEHRYKWRDVYKHTLDTKYTSNKKENTEFITNGTYIYDFFNHYNKKIIDGINKYEIAKALIGDFFALNYASLVKPIKNYLWIKQLIYNDTIDKNSFFPQKVNYQNKIDAIMENMSELFDSDIKSFFIVTDNEQKPYVLYDTEYILQNLEQEYYPYMELRKESNESKKIESISEDDIKYIEVLRFLYGTPDVQNLAFETIKEYEKKDEIWIDCYNENSQLKLEFLADNKYLLLIRLSKLNDSEEFITSGMIGFYGNESLYNKPQSIQPKQLLMLLRRDMNEFIEKHHKNDEFAKLREEEIRNRYAYLAGHGRKMLQDLIEDSDCHYLFTDIVGTINKLQYVFSTEGLDEKRRKILKDGFPYEVHDNIVENIKEMAVKIYKTAIIENEVELKNELEISDEDKTTIESFKFNHKLLKFIFFELFVNAKKNRYHFIDDIDSKNELKISISTKNNKLIIEIKGTGAKFHEEMRDKINKRFTPVKDKGKYEIASGIELMRDVIGLLNDANKVYIPNPVKINKNMYWNSVNIELCEMIN